MIERRADFKVHSEHLDSAKAAIREFVTVVASSEPQTITYHSYQTVDDPTRFFHVMAFEDEAARDFHTNTDHVRSFVDRLYPLCDQTPEFTDISTIADA